MVRLTRSSSKQPISMDEENQENEEPSDVPGTGATNSDMGFQLKVIIAQERSFSGSDACLIRHPKNGEPVLFCLSEHQCCEILRFGEKSRSWFFGETVIGDGGTCLYSPYHPVFLGLPYFYNNKEKFLELDVIICDESVPATNVLLRNKQFLDGLDKICDRKDICETVVFRLNMSKAFDWLKDRFNRLKSILVEEGTLHKVITENDEVLSRYAFGIFCDYINPSFASDLKTFLNISDAPANDFERMETALKRKCDDEYELLATPEIKKVKESVVKKQLVQASRGTKSITNFFKKK